MKKSLLISLTVTGIIGLTTATTLYAQTATGTSIIDKMKAAARTSFTLSADLNPGQTGFESAPVSGKKTGNMLTAAEWNRMLELVAQGGSGAGGTGWENVPLTDTADYDTSCLYRFDVDFIVDDANRKYMNATSAKAYMIGISNKFLQRFLDAGNSWMWGIPSANKSQYGYRNSSGVFTVTNNVQITKMEKLCGGVGSSGPELWKCTCGGYINMVTTQNLTFGETCVFGNGGTASNVQYSSWSCTKIQNAGGTGTSAPTLSNITYINPDNTDFAPLDCVAGMNYMINPIAFSATSASTYTDKKLAVLKPGNWTVKGTNFSRNRNITSGSSHTLRVSTIIDGTTTHLLNNTVDLGLYANSFSSPVIVPTGKTVELRASLRNNVLYGGNIVAWCTN